VSEFLLHEFELNVGKSNGPCVTRPSQIITWNLKAKIVKYYLRYRSLSL